jgi:F-type H+-transporting ATPase subunit gamma
MPANNIRGIKRRIKSVQSIEHITNAMKLVSSAKLRKAKNIYTKSQEYLHFVTESIEDIIDNAEEMPDKYLKNNSNKQRSCYIIITSNGGLCGSFSTNIIKKTLREISNDHNLRNRKSPLLVTIGTKGKEYFSKRNFEIKSEYLLPPENISFVDTHTISKPIIEIYNKGEIDEIKIIYNAFVNSLQQQVKMMTLLPFKSRNKSKKEKIRKQVEYEPSIEGVFNYLVPKYVEIMIYGAIVESATCEHAARRIAMENATDNAKDMIASLRLNYNRIRQTAITNEISEIVRGSEALK